ncbi:VanZ family protein [Aeromicrobium senzhongii]|uniref:VanZ family protein n=1 Tax=Aeromicrobium senzhongii TaxID=2663859 RepID=A0ABX6SSD2_9ACTN|nr:VanZ family protein [Aeromicrobium senzhongii]QNL94304.1 VanZ family protein [Aeromicrobium senzhongii]
MRDTLRPSAPVVGSAVLYVLLVAAIGLWPRHVDAGLSIVDWRLTKGIADLLSVSASEVVGLAEVAANAVFFVPVGIFLALVFPRVSVLAAVTLGCLLSGGIELAQALGPVDRTASILDVVADAGGAVLGFAALRAATHGSRLAKIALAVLVLVTLGVVSVLVCGLLISGS